jgi:hypothetical protein
LFGLCIEALGCKLYLKSPPLTHEERRWIESWDRGGLSDDQGL